MSTTKAEHQRMSIGSKVSIVVSLLLVIVGVGVLCARWGYVAGSKALAGVTQPNVAPRFKRSSSAATTSPAEGGMALLDERTVLIKVYNFTHPQAKPAKPKQGTSAQTNGDVSEPEQTSESPEELQAIATSEPTPVEDELAQPPTLVNLPLTSEDRGLSLKVTDIQRQDGSLVLSVELNNQSEQTVRFLYSFLDIRDDRDRTLSAITNGLPGRLPANSEPVAGTILIPAALLDEAQSLSLTLTDYPDQALKLRIDEIPTRR